MVTDLEIRNLGPHVATTLALLGHPGAANVGGASESGKTYLIEALCYVLTGTASDGDAFPTEWIRDGEDKAEVKAAIAGVGMVRATLTRSGSPNRSFTALDGVVHGGQSQKQLAAKLGRIGEVPALARFVLAPMLWPALEREDLGRPLRNLLLSALPRMDERPVVEAIMRAGGFELLATDPVGLDAALAKQTTANRERDEAAGALRGAEATLGGIPADPVAPDAAEVEAARAVLDARDRWTVHHADAARAAELRADAADLEARRRALTEAANAPLPAGPDEAQAAAARETIAAADAWTAYNVAKRDHDHRVQARSTAIDAQARRTKALEELGGRPVVPNLDPSVRDSIAKAPAAIAALRTALDSARAKLAAAEMGLDKHGPATDVCPTCERSGWKGHEQAVAALRAEVERARADVTREADRLARAEAKLDGLKKQEADHAAAVTAAANYDRTVRALGPAVELLPLPEAPTAPAVVAPTPDEVDAALGILDAEKWAEGARATASSAKTRAAIDLDALPAAAEIPAVTAPDIAEPTADAVRDADALLRRVATIDADRARLADERVRAGAGVHAARAALEVKTAESARVTAMVAAYRRAPTVIADRQSKAFGPMGPLSLRFPPDEGRGTRAIEVLIDGRDWRGASDGKKILADLYLRAAVRRLAKLEMLPIFVDRANLWSGAFPAFPRVVYLWTGAEGEPLTVDLVDAMPVAA